MPRNADDLQAQDAPVDLRPEDPQVIAKLTELVNQFQSRLIDLDRRIRRIER
jgi:hypothetical protein